MTGRRDQEPLREKTEEEWARMRRRIDELAAPLLASGWKIVERHQEESWEHGDSVMVDLRRGEEAIELEYYDYDDLMVWAMDDEADNPHGDPSPPLFMLENPVDTVVHQAFEDHGWL